jgi:RimJ/RimL family protein N-acetyltransferase
MFIRPATYNDLDAAAKIYDDARAFMRESGNPTQWAGVYPGKDDIEEGIEKGTSYVCEDKGEVVATFHFEANADDPTYHKIYDGCWKNDHPYAVIHRIAVKYHGRGIADFCFNECFKILPNIKIDTHKDNIPMQRSLQKNGFEYCGIIYVKDGTPRAAFQKTK